MAGMELANSPVVWLFASAIIVLVILQAVKFLTMSRKAAGEVGLSRKDTNRAIKTGIITAIGPSVGIIIVAVSLISLIGNPLTMMRIGVIGSAPIESMGAQLSAETAGVSLSGEGLSPEVFNLIVWTLCIGGAGWMLFCFVATSSLSKIQTKLTETSKGEYLLGMIASGAMIAVFGSLIGGEMLKGSPYIFTGVVAIFSSLIINYISDKKEIKWLKEWSLGFSILISLTAVYFFI